ncbi:MAG TPA: hypothetical protein VGG74_26695 [Kofleriaceae bacterium]|jgi:hypothetical protein
MRLAWVASAAVHAGAAAWLALTVVRGEVARPRPRLQTIAPAAAQPIAPRAPAWIEVAVLDDHVPSTGSRPVATRGHALATIATSHEPVATTAEPAGETAASPGASPSPLPPSSLLRMRGLELRAPADVLHGDVAYSPPPEPTGRLEWHADGHGVIGDRVTTVRVEPDGVAHFDDKSDFEIHSPLPSLHTLRHLPSALEKAPGALHEALKGWYRDLQEQNDYLEHYDRRQHLAEIPNGCADYEELNCIDPDLPPPKKESPVGNGGGGGGLISGTADISAWLQRKFVGDPYASRKKKLLEDTFAERAAHGEAYRAQQLARAAEEMQANLERFWAKTPDVAARRAALFELWDECAEGEDPLGEAGQRARDLVMMWIRAKLPAGSAGAYTADELDALAKRKHSAQAFEPYASR